MSNRTNHSIKNFIVGTINRIAWIVIPFVFRTIIIYVLGQEYLGINNLFSSILQVLNVADIGLGNAIQASIYKPIAEEEYDKVSALLKLYRNIYRVIGGAILVASIVILPFLPNLIKGNCPEDVNIYVLFLLYAVNTSLSYLLFAYASILINASQRMDLTGSVALISKLVTSVLQVVALIYFKDIVLYVACNVLCTALQNILNYIIVRKKFSQYTCAGKVDRETKSLLYKNTMALIIQKVGTTLSTSFDTIVISAFIGLSAVGIYGNYQYISQAVGSFLDLAFAAIIASVGNSIVKESLKKNKRDFNDLSFVNSWVVGWCTICLACLLQNFEAIWTSGTMMESDTTVLAIAVCFYVTYIRKIVLTYKDALGLWYADKWKPLVGGGFNLVCNIIFVRLFGVVGVVLSTILSYLLIEIPWENKIFFQFYLKDGPKGYYKDYAYMLLSTILAGGVTYFLCSFDGYGLKAFALRLMICAIVPNVIIVLLNCNRTPYRLVRERLSRIIEKRK